MTDKEKMLAGELYDPNEATLMAEKLRAKDLCHRYNQLPPSRVKEQGAIMRELLGRTGSSFMVTAPFWCDFGYNIEVGENFYTNHDCVFLDCNKITFGDNVQIAPLCGFYTAGHPIDAGRRAQGLEYAKPITVGNNVWFGGGVHVMPGVTIGDDTVIGAGSVVTRDIPSGVVAAGNPCRVIREITDGDRG